MSDDPASDAKRSASAIRRVADALGCPVETLYGEHDGSDAIVSASELIRLWLAIDTPEGRCRVLACARAVLAEQEPPRPGGGSGPR